MKTTSWMCCLLVLLPLWGCGGGDDEQDPQKQTGKNGDSQSLVEDKPLDGTPQVSVADWETIQDHLDSLHGQPVAVLIWTTWNKHLQTDLRDFVATAKQFREQDVVFVSVNADFDGEDDAPTKLLQEKVQSLVTEAGANFTHFVSSTADYDLQAELDDVLFPAVLVYGRDGQIQKRLFLPAGTEVPHPLELTETIPGVLQTALDEPKPTAKPVRDSSSPTKSRANPKPKEQSTSAAAGSTKTVSVELDDWQGVEKRVAAQSGKVVVLDLWSTSCLPCIREFPHLVELQQQFPDSVVCMSLNLDYYGAGQPEDVKPEVLAFLKKQQASITNVICTQPDEALYEQLQLPSIPAVFVYDREGKLAKRFDSVSVSGEFTYKDHIIPLVKSLLK